MNRASLSDRRGHLFSGEWEEDDVAGGMLWSDRERGFLRDRLLEGKTAEQIRDDLVYSGFHARSVEAVAREMRSQRNGDSPRISVEPKKKIIHDVEKGEIRGLNISTLDECFEAAGLNKNDWEILKSSIQYNGRSVSQLWLQIRPVFPKASLVMEKVLEEIRQAALGIQYEKVEYPKFDRLLLAVIALFDVHLGKLAWMRETGQNYDIKIAKTYFKTALMDLLTETDKLGISRYMVPVGQDFFHTDTVENTTTSGTRQDVDGRWQKAFDEGYELWVWAIEQMLLRAPVDIMEVAGNHDKQTSYFLNKTLQARYHNHPHVRFDVRALPRKPYRWGKNLLVVTHGQPTKDYKRLLESVTAEQKWDWAETSYREVLCGDLHKKEQEEIGALRIQRLSSLAGTDAWHGEMGFVGHIRAAQALVYDQVGGRRYTIEHNILTSLEEERATAPILGMP